MILEKITDQSKTTGLYFELCYYTERTLLNGVEPAEVSNNHCQEHHRPIQVVRPQYAEDD